LTDWEDSLEKLEAKLARAAELFKKGHAEKHQLQQEIEKLRAELKERARRTEGLERELISLRREREDVRGRIEKLLQQIDVLTQADSAG